MLGRSITLIKVTSGMFCLQKLHKLSKNGWMLLEWKESKSKKMKTMVRIAFSSSLFKFNCEEFKITPKMKRAAAALCNSSSERKPGTRKNHGN